MFELLVQESDHCAQVAGIVILARLVKALFEENNADKFADEVVCVVDESIGLPHVVMLRGVVSELAAHKSEDRERLVVDVAVLDPDGNLTVGEVASGFCLSELLHRETLINVVSSGVGKHHASHLTATVETEVNKFV